MFKSREKALHRPGEAVLAHVEDPLSLPQAGARGGIIRGAEGKEPHVQNYEAFGYTGARGGVPMRNTRLLAALALAAFTILAQAQQKEIKIGLISALSGPFAGSA